MPAKGPSARPAPPTPKRRGNARGPHEFLEPVPPVRVAGEVRPRPCLGNVGKAHLYERSTPATRICPKCKSVIDHRVKLLSPMAIECRAPDPVELF